MPIPEEYKPIIDMLEQRTAEKQVSWRESASADIFIVTLKNFSLSIHSGYDSTEDEKFVAVAIRDSSGKEIDRFWVSAPHYDYDRLNSLYEMARRKARNIDEALKEFSEELSEEGEVGISPPPPQLPPGDDIAF